jgi:ferritin
MPKLSKSLCDAMNVQVQNELASAYLYLAMSSGCAAKNLRGSAHWLRMQWEEELLHATKMLDYIIERGNEVRLDAVPNPDFEFETLSGVFEQVLSHEQGITVAINELYALATEAQDFAAQSFLQWFVTEQIEEENSAQDVLDMLKIGGDEGAGLLMVDQSLGQRVASVEPTP